MKNLKVGKKLFISYALILTMLIVGCIVSVVDLIKLGDQIEVFYNGPFTVNGSANIINANFERMQKGVYRAISNSDSAIVDEAVLNAKDSAEKIKEQMPVIKEHFLGDQQIIERLDTALAKLEPMRETVLLMAKENRNAEAANYMENNNIIVIHEAQKELDKLVESGNAKGEELINGLKSNQADAIRTLVLLGGASVIVSIIFGVYITRGITRPVETLEKAARSMARGDLSSVQISYEAGDELGSLADDMRSLTAILLNVIQDETYLLGEMADGNFDVRSKTEASYVGDFQRLLLSMRAINSRLSSTLRQMSQAASEVASGSEQLSSEAQILAQGTMEQAASVEEASHTINDISDQADGNAEKAQEASSKAQKVKSDTEQSSEKMQDMLCAMSDISRDSIEIRKIVKTIEDIAFQTNILALNAAVEAARAGDQGKGFSAVANEVQHLANKSSAAAKSTAGLIENAVRTVEKGKKTAYETADILSEVVRGVDSVSGALQLITEASVRQSDAVKQITESVDMISNVVQTNSAMAEESAAASEELSSQAELLNGLASHFKIKTEE